MVTCKDQKHPINKSTIESYVQDYTSLKTGTKLSDITLLLLKCWLYAQGKLVLHAYIHTQWMHAYTHMHTYIHAYIMHACIHACIHPYIHKVPAVSTT